MKLEALFYIVEVDRCKSISKAAKKLYITQPTLSVAISNLENELGYSIFTRSRHGVVLTEQGKEFVEAANEIVMRINDLTEMTNKTNQMKKVKIIAVPEICDSFLMDLTEMISEKNMDITLEITESRNNELIDQLKARESNIGIGCYTHANKEKTIQTLKDSKLEYEEILYDSFMVYLSKREELSYRDVVYSKDLEGKKAIMFTDSELLSFAKMPSTNISKNHLAFNDRSNIKKAIARDIGYAILPGIMAIDDLYVETNLIKVKPLADSNVKLTSILIYDKYKMNKKEKQIINCIKQMADAMQKKINEMQTLEIENNDFDAKIYY